RDEPRSGSTGDIEHHRTINAPVLNPGESARPAPRRENPPRRGTDNDPLWTDTVGDGGPRGPCPCSPPVSRCARTNQTPDGRERAVVRSDGGNGSKSPRSRRVTILRRISRPNDARCPVTVDDISAIQSQEFISGARSSHSSPA